MLYVVCFIIIRRGVLLEIEMSERYDEVENRFGIKAYASQHLSGFAAVLKGRFSDFSVREGEQYQLFQ